MTQRRVAAVPAVRSRLARGTVRSAVAGLFVVLLGAGATGFADTPADWADSPHVSGFHFLLILFLIPAGIGLVITTLVMLPSLVRRSQPGRELETSDRL
jgi:hypothetical protein